MEFVKVTEIEHYTDTLFRFKTERPSTFRFTAGEFTMIGMGDNDVSRAYSITSGPYDEYLEFYSIKVPDGPLTSRLQNIAIGDEIEIGTKPTGTLTLANLDLGGNLWLLATGTGIAPFISLLRDPYTYDAFDSIRVIWSVRYPKELEAYDQFLKDQDILYTPTVTRDSAWQGMNKRITVQISDQKQDILPAKDKIMVCGSMPFNEDIQNMLNSWGWQEGTRKTAGTFVQEKAFTTK